ncbi:MAG: MBOAT family protein [Lachnospiraceae bacterium]|nr:MBOAT family protein [Lachnospiraceae bacterium]
MLFTSYGFIAFLAVIIMLYYLVPRKWQWGLLLFGSYVFYFFSGWSNLLYLAAATLSTYVTALVIGKRQAADAAYMAAHKAELSREERKAHKEAEKAKQRRVMVLGILLAIGMLAAVKYTNFMIANINGVLSLLHSPARLSFLDIMLPMGISFYVFQSAGYLIDVYRGKTKAEGNLFRFALFVSFFPQLVQGPISRYDDLAEGLYAEHPFDKKNVAFGLQRVLWGYFKKMVIADRLLTAVTAIIGVPEVYGGAFVFAGMVLYAVELYCDFTGGIDITIGIARTLGIKVAENFVRPYFSKNLKEFWNRWHITMGTWFTDYIFYPVSVSRFMLKVSRGARKHLGDAVGKRVPVYLSCLIVWSATGIWHGASWNFIVWGLGNCIVLLISQELEPFYRWFHAHVKVRGSRLWDAFCVGRTLLIVSVLRLFDCYRNVPLTFRMFGSMVTADNWSGLFDGRLLELGLSGTDYMVAGLGTLLVLGVSLLQRRKSVRERIAALPYPLRFLLWYGLFLLVLLFGAYGIGYDASQFIYNQF